MSDLADPLSENLFKFEIQPPTKQLLDNYKGLQHARSQLYGLSLEATKTLIALI